jgi:nucleoside-diphosphate-sugar epimerase
VLRVLTGYFGDGTAFPIHVLRDIYAARKSGSRATHILVISDDGVSTMFDTDEQGNSGWDIAKMALTAAKGGGTLVLNLPAEWEVQRGPYATIRRARDEQGWQVHRVSSLDELVEFARQFSRLRYGPTGGSRQKAEGRGQEAGARGR